MRDERLLRDLLRCEKGGEREHLREWDKREPSCDEEEDTEPCSSRIRFLIRIKGD